MSNININEKLNQEKIFKSLEEFYPFYLQQHSNNLTRLLHFIGTLLAIYNILKSIFFLSPVHLLYGLILGYGFAWIGHFFIEKNKPATFKYPLLSFVSDFKLVYSILTGQISKDLKKYKISDKKYFNSDLF